MNFLAASFASVIFFTSFTYLSADYTTFPDIPLEKLQNFPGDWSLAPEEAQLSLKYVTYDHTLRVLEFGAGESTLLFTNLFKDKNIDYDYHCFEHDPKYAKPIDNVTYYLYHLPWVPYDKWSPTIKAIQFPYFPIFDLIIVDGPHGVSRSEWYAKFKPYTRPGTVILVDDFSHFNEFSLELDKNFDYTTIIEYNQCYLWECKNEGLDPITHRIVPKTFKIVIVK